MFETMQMITLVLSLSLALAGMTVFWWLGQRQLQNMHRAIAEQKQQLDTMKNDVRALFSGAVGGDARLQKLESRSRRIIERQEQLENNKQTERPYEQAIRMVHQGSKVEDIMAVCNLSKGEADLIIMMHRTNKSESDPAENFH
jgi:hypothetical protein